MSSTSKAPTLVTYRSAEALRDAGIRYAYMKAGMFASLVASALFGAGGLWILLRGLDGPHPLVWLLLVLAVASGLISVACGRAMEFPHFPRLTLDELEIMKSGMGLSAKNFQLTHDSVLHGSEDEVRSIWKANELLQRLMRSSGQAS